MHSEFRDDVKEVKIWTDWIHWLTRGTSSAGRCCRAVRGTGNTFVCVMRSHEEEDLAMTTKISRTRTFSLSIVAVELCAHENRLARLSIHPEVQPAECNRLLSKSRA